MNTTFNRIKRVKERYQKTQVVSEDQIACESKMMRHSLVTTEADMFPIINEPGITISNGKSEEVFQPECIGLKSLF